MEELSGQRVAIYVACTIVVLGYLVCPIIDYSENYNNKSGL